MNDPEVLHYKNAGHIHCQNPPKMDDILHGEKYRCHGHNEQDHAKGAGENVRPQEEGHKREQKERG